MSSGFGSILKNADFQLGGTWVYLGGAWGALQMSTTKPGALEFAQVL